MFRHIPLLLLAACSASGFGQNLTAADLVKQVLAKSQNVIARTFQLHEAEHAMGALRSPKSPELELSPGIGFTNSNFVLGQSFDLSGQRAAAALRARSEVEVARAALRKAQVEIAAAGLSALANYQSALQHEDISRVGRAEAAATLDAIRKRVAIGEAPSLQETRAEVELQRSEQAYVAAKAESAIAKTTLLALLGKPEEADLATYDWVEKFDLDALSLAGPRRHPEVSAAEARLAVATAAETEARRRGLPTLFAGVTADTWSLDRRPFQRENIGLQVRLALPVFDRGEFRFAALAAESARKIKEAELRSIQLEVSVEVSTAITRYRAAKSIATSYEAGIVPKAERMVKSMQSGLESGIANFIDVLEAQRALSQLRKEATEANRNLRLAEVRLLAAVASLPGLESK